MKLLFFFLLAVNLILLFYIFNDNDTENAVANLPQRDPVVVEPSPDVLESTSPETLSVEVPDSDLEPSVSRLCYRVGPFERSMDADRVQGELSMVGIKAERTNSEQKTKDNYWVYLPPFSSKAEAIKTSRELASRGITDNFVISTGTNKNAISLGLYTSKDRAKERRAEIVGRGYEPLVETRSQSKTSYWLNVISKQLTETEAISTVKSSIRKLTQVNIHKHDC